MSLVKEDGDILTWIVPWVDQWTRTQTDHDQTYNRELTTCFAASAALTDCLVEFTPARSTSVTFLVIAYEAFDGDASPV